MKLTRLRIEQVRQFRQALEITELEPGINLFVGPNESGKSTMVHAIRAAFFEKHKSSSVDDLQPWGDSSARPEIELAFQWQGSGWTLNKRFLKNKRCDLHIDHQHLSGDEAEERLAELLGYSFAGRGASKPEHWGIPGLLWVQQGDVQEIHNSVSYAGDYLQTALGRSLGEIASSSGDALIGQVEKARGQLLTNTGRETGEYKALIAQCDKKDAELAELRQKITQYREQVDHLGNLRKQQQDIDAPRPWQAQRQQAEKAGEQLAEVKRWQAEQEREEQALRQCRQEQALHRQQLRDFQNQANQLAEREKDKQATAEALEDIGARGPRLQAQLKQAKQQYDAAVALYQQARQQSARQALQKEYDQRIENLKQQQDTLQQARDCQAELQKSREKYQAIALDKDSLARLRQVEQQLNELRIRQQTLATRLHYALENGQTITVGQNTVSGTGEALLLETTNIAIPGIGSLRLEPGGTDVAELRRQQQELESDRQSLLQQLDIPSLEDGEKRAEDSQMLNRQIDHLQLRLDSLAPKGVDALSAQVTLLEQQRDAHAEKLKDMPEHNPDLPDEAAAESERDRAHENLKAIEQAHTEHKRELGLAEQAQATALREWQLLNDQLQAPDRKAREQRANDALADLNAEAAKLQRNLEERQQQIDEANPDILQQDVERFTRSADAMEKAAGERSRSIERLEVELDALGAQGLEEKYAALRQETERLQRRRDELARHARALDLLLNLLRDKRQALTRQLQAPLQKHLNHYLKLLFPGASLSVDENLIPTSLTRTVNGGGEERGEVTALSYGAREQMGLISRLAYADLLHEAGKPTLVMLDDALVHSDANRLVQMKRILFDAAQRHQILLFSCHLENWQDLGVSPRDMQALKVNAA
ncbi:MULTISPECIES: AAA family ATPase [unclassified Microbulbifer]|uniref:AAA family ATPase n=1 Tax=unclassified Microbulbifer TaxID=2619833 RepID=UPI0027E44700|nr:MULTISPECIES: AAA family ATPase [unclassified Microbulbifer]